jgi:hypothetical protein
VVKVRQIKLKQAVLTLGRTVEFDPSKPTRLTLKEFERLKALGLKYVVWKQSGEKIWVSLVE